MPRSKTFDTFEPIMEHICAHCMAANEFCDGDNHCPFTFSRLEALCNAVDEEAENILSQAENYTPMTWDEAYFHC